MQVIHKQIKEMPNSGRQIFVVIEEVQGLGRRLFAARKAKKLSQRKLAAMLGISYGFVNKLELEQRSINLDLLRRIEQILEVELINLKIDEEDQ